MAKTVEPKTVELARKVEAELIKLNKYPREGFIYSYDASDAARDDPKGWLGIHSIRQHDADTCTYFVVEWTALKIFQLDPRCREEQIRSLDLAVAELNNRGVYTTYVKRFQAEIDDNCYSITLRRSWRVRWYKDAAYVPDNLPAIVRDIVTDTEGRANFEYGGYIEGVSEAFRAVFLGKEGAAQ